MTAIEIQLTRFEHRNPRFDMKEQAKRVQLLDRLTAINRFEGIEAGPMDRRLFELLASGRISQKEFLDLCLEDARAN